MPLVDNPAGVSVVEKPLPHRPLVIAHRGASALAPENTLRAFRMASALDADGVEFDVQLSGDGHPVVIHDRTLKRTTNGFGPVSRYTAAELSKLDATSWFDRRLSIRPRVRAKVHRVLSLANGFDWGTQTEGVATLEAVLAALKAAGLRRIYIELKGVPETREDLLRGVVRHVRRFNLQGSARVISFHHDILRRSAEIASDIRTGINVPAPIRALPVTRTIIKAAEDAGASEVSLHFSLATSRMVGALHEQGLEVAAWTANRKLVMRRLVVSEVDAIMSNFPDRLRDIVESPPKARFVGRARARQRAEASGKGRQHRRHYMA